MDRKKRWGIIILSVFFLGGCTLPFLASGKSALQVNAVPNASVYLNGSHVGQTPFFDDKLKPGDYVVRLLVEDDPTKDWQTRVTLSPKIVSVVNRIFGPSESESANYFLQLEPLASKDKLELSILTVPDNVIVKVDDQPQGFSPVAIKDMAEGDHTIALSAPGYQEMSLVAQTKMGYKLIVSAQLARTSADALKEASASAELATDEASKSAQEKVTPTPTSKAKAVASPTPTKKVATVATSSGELSRPYVKILETGTGWLRVRSEPNANTDNEVAKVDVGETFPYIGANDNGWYEIEYETGKNGWISGRYAEVYK